ncbi:MAG: trypsin-like peptidase domain-containing protein [Gemmatimonadetes bacterium]|nr:trypsin-like peptidase domain-containing protein [Gemmatimonadota bacterium]
MRTRRSLLVLLLLVAAGGLGSAVVLRGPGGKAVELLRPEPVAAAAPVVQQDVDESRRTALVRAAERVAPAVVSVHVVRRERVRASGLWESFFLPPDAAREVSGLGSGFIIREDGLVLTNEHVVRGAEQVVVTLADGREYEGEVVGTDELSDLALLRVAARALPVAPIGDSDRLLIGEWVVAIGNPFGYLLANTEPTVTAGVVSGVGRNIIPAGEEERGYYLDMIQTDASINPGNSGGPLVNALGQVVGVNSSIFSHSGGSEGLGFAIPIKRARRIALELLEDGRVRRAWVGLELETSARGGRDGRGREVRVAHVAPGSPAAQAGLRPGAVLARVGGQVVRAPLDWEAALLDAPVGQPVEITVVEQGRERTVRVVPMDLPSVTAERIRALADFELVTLTPPIRAERGLVSDQGALIVSLSEAARQIGLRVGDLIVQINRSPIRTAEEAASALRRLAGRGPVRLFLERQGQYGSISFYITS